MENKMKRSSRSVMRGSSYSRRSSSRNKEANSSSTTLPTTEAAIAGTGTSKNALRERTRVESLRKAYLELQAAIPSVPPNTKLSKLDVLVLATTYISHLTQLLQEDNARLAHDDNNNNTRGGESGKCMTREAGNSISSTYQEYGPKVAQQRGFLHPVKKWPMRARLYTDVGAANAIDLIAEPVTTSHHLHVKMNQGVQPSDHTQLHDNHQHGRFSNCCYQPVNQISPCKHQSHVVNANPLSGMVDPSVEDYERLSNYQHHHHNLNQYHGKASSARTHFQTGRFSEYNQAQRYRYSPQYYTPPANFTHCNAWEKEHGWALPYVIHNDLSSCPVQCNVTQHGVMGYGGSWTTAWNA